MQEAPFPVLVLQVRKVWEVFLFQKAVKQKMITPVSHHLHREYIKRLGYNLIFYMILFSASNNSSLNFRDRPSFNFEVTAEILLHLISFLVE